MRKKIDAHVHIVPGRLLGQTDRRYDVSVEAYGLKRFRDGRFYQFMPDYCADSRFETATLIRCMDNLGIEKAIIMQSPCFSLNDDVIQAVQSYPDRLKGAMIIDPRDEGCLDEIVKLRALGLSVIKFEMSSGLGFGHPGCFPGLRFDSTLFEKIWSKAVESQLTITIDPGPIGGAGYQVDALSRMIRKYPALHWVICHVGLPFAGIKEDAVKYKQWSAMLALAEQPNVWFDVAALPALFQSEEYPYPAVRQLLREFITEYGPGKLIWGSDVPATLCFGTYRQLSALFDNSLFLSETEKDGLFSLNALKAYYN